MNFYPTIDADDFLAGSISEAGFELSTPDNVVLEPVPSTALGPLERWRWVGAAWVALTNYRGHSWYDPEDPKQVHRPATWDDAPPAGWVYWTPGENPVPTPAAELRQAKIDKWVTIKSAARAAAVGGFTASGFNWDSDLETQMSLMLAIQDMTTAGGPTTLKWSRSEGQIVTLTLAQAQALMRAMQNHIQTQRERAADLRQLIVAATTKAEVDAIVW